jgi:hypothetical protein
MHPTNAVIIKNVPPITAAKKVISIKIINNLLLLI